MEASLMNSQEKIDSGSIQTELNRLKESPTDGNQIKASLFNLVIYVHDPKRLDYFNKIVKMVVDQFPCRIIFIQGNSNSSKTTLQVNVQTGSKGISDQIYIIASGDGLTQVPFLIYPLLIPDLPIYLFWSQDLTKDAHILPCIKRLATRIIIDSENTDDLQNFSQTIRKQLQLTSTDIVDMNWYRIAGWKQIIARAFDSKDRIDLLGKATHIKIIYNDVSDPSSTQPKTQAIYLQAWLASCLGWTFKKLESVDKKIVLHYIDHSAPAQIHLEPQTRKDMLPEEIIDFEISDPENYDCLFSRKNNNEIVVKASNQYQCLLPFTLLLPTLQSGRSFMQEIFYQRISSQYPEVLKMISQVNWS